MAVRVETIPVHGDNYAFLVICEQSGQAAAVDPADADAVIRRARELGVQITALWCTHHHGDHTGGNRSMVASLGSCKVYGHSADAGRIPELTDSVEDGATVALGQLEARILHTPGHTSGSICYLVEDRVLTGDTLFACGCGRLFEGDPPTMFQSLARLRALPAETLVYCGHEYTQKNLDFAWGLEPENPDLKRRIERVDELRRQGSPSVPFTLADELATSPFMRAESPEIVSTLRERHGLTEQDPLSVFTRIRQLRNSF